MADHFSEAASALHAVGDKRNLALVHSLSGSALAQQGRYDEALMALAAGRTARAGRAGRRRRGDRVRQPGQRRDDPPPLRAGADAGRARGVAAPAVSARPWPGGGARHARTDRDPPRTAVPRRRGAHRALAVRTPLLYHETTGAIFDCLAQIHLIRGDYDACADALAQARDAFGVYDAHTPRWYDWSLRLIEARLAARRGDFARAVALADAIADSPGVPPADQVHAHLIAADALVQAGQHAEVAATPRPHGRRTWTRARRRAPGASFCASAAWSPRPPVAPPRAITTWRKARRSATCSASAISRRSASWRSAASPRAPARARWPCARSIRPARPSATSGAARDVRDVEAARALLDQPGTGEFVGAPADADDAVVRRIVDAAALPDLLARETAAALLEISAADAAVVLVRDGRDEPRVVAHAGCDVAFAAIAGARGGPEPAPGRLPGPGRAAGTRRDRPRGWPRSRCRTHRATWSSGGCAWWARSRGRDSSCATRANAPCGRPTSARSNGRWSR